MNSSLQPNSDLAWDSQPSSSYDFHADPSQDVAYQSDDDLTCFESSHFNPESALQAWNNAAPDFNVFRPLNDEVTSGKRLFEGISEPEGFQA